jgi:hypothetical protein
VLVDFGAELGRQRVSGSGREQPVRRKVELALDVVEADLGSTL